MAHIELPHHHGEEMDLSNIQNQLDCVEKFQIVSNIFKQLSDPTRLKIFWFLCHKEECVIDIAFIMNMSSPAISHHLRELKTSGLIVSRREGKEVYYKAAETKEAQMLHHIIEDVMKISCPK